MPAYISATIGSVGYPPILPCIGIGSAFLVGSYSFLPHEQRFNAAFAVYPDGTVPMPYFKRVLIPFGEYMPLASWFPGLKDLNARAGSSARGPGRGLQLPDAPAGRLHPCREGFAFDLLRGYRPSLARESVRQARAAANITSDSWFGRSLAPHQHHLIAAFRAIENRRFLIRATDTGLSAVVDPLGKTIASIPPFSEGTATAQVGLLDYQSPYTNWVGDRPWWGLLGLSIGLVTVRRWRR